MKRTIPRNVNAFGERFILAMIRRFPDENALISLSKLTGMCEPLCRKITTRPDPSMNQIRHLLAMCEIVSQSRSGLFDFSFKANHRVFVFLQCSDLFHDGSVA